MKSNIFKSMMVAVVAIFAGYNVYLAHAKTSNISADILMANVEALAQNEGGGETVITCSASCRDGIGLCWKTSELDSRYCQRSDNPENSCSCAHLPG